MDTEKSDGLARENEQLRERLREAEETMEAIRRGEIDALVIDKNGPGIYTLEDGDRAYRQMIETMRQGAVMVLEEGGVYYCNHAFARMVGRPLERVIGSTIYDWIHPEDAAALRELIEKGGDGGADVELRFMDKDGEAFPTLVAANALDHGEVRGICLAVTDLRELTALERAMEALADADRRKDDFLAMLSHELRNPLAPIRTAVHILKVIGTDNPVKHRQHVTIERQIAHMARLLDDLLDVARITRGKITLHRQTLSLNDLLAQVVDAITAQIQELKQKLSYTALAQDLMIDGDPDRLAQVMGNLMINASKFTPEGGRIWLEAGREENEAIIRVRDNGIGIAPEMLPRIFEPFIQADRTLDRKQGGLGIGLTMAKKLVEMHGGTIVGKSAGLGCGSEFVVHLPLLEGAEAELPAPAPRPKAKEKNQVSRRVLVVDDVVDSATSLAELLRIWGHEAREAHHGKTAIEIARVWKPEVVLLDLGLPGMSGFEVARRLRQEHAVKNMALMAMTGYGQQQDLEATQAAGFDYHLVKPVDLNKLRALLNKM